MTVAPPLYRFDPAGEAVPSCPWLIIQGDEDELVDVEEVVEWINAMPPGPELVVIDGVDHFFHGRLAELKETLVNLLTEH